MTEQAWLACSVSPGQFPTEYAVSGEQHDGRSFSLFAPAEAVEAPPDGQGPGFLRVNVIDRRGDLVLVRLPAQSFENGQHVTVRASQLRPAVPPARRVGA